MKASQSFHRHNETRTESVRSLGTRKDLEEALAFAADGKVKATIEPQPLDSINDVFHRLKHGKVNGRVVLEIGEEPGTRKVHSRSAA